MKKITIDRIFMGLLYIYPLVILFKPNVAVNLINTLLLILSLIKIKRDGFKKSFFEKTILIFLIGLAISLIDLRGDAFKLSFDNLKRLPRWIFLPFIVNQFTLTKKNLRKIYLTFSLGIYVYLTLIILQLLKVLEPLVEGRYHVGENAFYSQYIFIVGAYTLVNLYLLLNLKEEKRFVVVNYLIGLFLVLVSASRGMLLTTTLMSCLLLFFRSKKICLIVMVMVFLTSLSAMVMFKDNFIVKRISKTAKVKKQGDFYKIKFDGSSEFRLELQKEGLRLFKKYPINGVGYMRFSEEQDPSNCFQNKQSKDTYHHNLQ